jgi:RimJ/RimL family protein N-acetyltransferase
VLAPIDRVTLRRGGASLVCYIVPWDTETFGFTVAQIEQVNIGDERSTDALLDDFRAWSDGVGARLVACRLDHSDLSVSMLLEREGFRFVEMVYTPQFDFRRSLAKPVRDVSVEPAAVDDVDAIAEIASFAFSTGRFAMDNRLDQLLGQRRYAQWVRRGAVAPGQTLYKIGFEGQLAGFFLIEEHDAGLIYWHLTALSPRWQGQGLGLPVWQTMLHLHREAGAQRVETTISGHNLAVLNLYGRLGFSMTSAQMTFHQLRTPA